MDAPTAAIPQANQPVKWKAHEKLRNEDAIAAMQAAIQSIPPEHLLEPEAGEHYNTRDLAIQRFDNYAFSQGRELCISGGRAAQRVYIKCRAYGEETRNNRKLTEEDRQQKDEEGRYLGRPNRKILKKNCPYQVSAHKNIINGVITWLTKINNGTHTCAAIPNPLALPKYKNRWPGYAASVVEALKHQAANASAGEVRRLLSSNKLPPISSRDYWNMGGQIRQGTQKAGATKQERFEELRSALQQAGFHVRSRIYTEVNSESGDCTSRVLVQITFSTPEQIAFARRFASGFYICTDATFSTNQLRMPLSTIITTTNTGKTVPIMHSLVLSEAEQVFKEMHNFMNEFMFYDIPGPKVHIGDQGAGFVSATEKLAEEDIQMQLCEWHVAENIKTMLVNSGGYTKEKRKPLEELIWKYIKSQNPVELEANRAAFMCQLNQPEALNVKEHWRPKEAYFNRAYTRRYRNLGANTLQRGELIHPRIKARLHKELGLPEVATRIRSVIDEKFIEYERLEHKDRRESFRLQDTYAFRLLQGQVTNEAIRLTRDEWEVVKSDYRRFGQLDEDYQRHGPLEESQVITRTSQRLLEFYTRRFDTKDGHSKYGCYSVQGDCDLPVRYGLLCRHWMEKAMQDSASLPLSLFHPRWLLDGPPAITFDWQPSYATQLSTEDEAIANSDCFSNGGADMALGAASAVYDAITKTYPPEQAEVLADLFRRQTRQLLLEFEELRDKDNLIPVELPDALRTSKVEFKKKGETGKRGLTGLKQAERAVRNKEQAIQKSRQKKRQRLAVGVREELEIFRSVESSNAPPASTAPARLQCLPRAAVNKRKRQSTQSSASSESSQEQQSMLSNIFVRPFGLSSPTLVSSSQDSEDSNDFDDSDDSLTQLNTQDFRSQFETQATVILPMRLSN